MKTSLLTFIIQMVGFFICIKGLQLCNEQPTLDCQCEIENSLKVINCRYKNLRQIPTFTPSNTIFDKIIFADTCDFNNCNNITSLPANAFANLKVKSLDLRHNIITSYDLESFNNLVNDLEELMIEGDNVMEPPYPQMARLSNLKSLHMQSFGQAQMTVTNSLLDFNGLQKLSIQKFPKLTSMAVLPGLGKLLELTLKELPKMVEIPVASIQNMTKLQKLNIADTSITRVYGYSFTVLSNLMEISFERNKISTIDLTAFADVTDTLDFLSLSFNNLHSDSLVFLNTTQWPMLTHLDLGYNNLAPLADKTFNTMPKLIYLVLSEVGLTRAKNSYFQGLTNLHTLDLSYNQIQEVEARAFQASPSLEELRLDKQDIPTNFSLRFNENSFAGIETSLQKLSLTQNVIEKTIFWNNVKKLQNLTELDIPNMQIDSIPDYAFSQNTKLEKIDLSSNSITNVNQATFFGPRTTLKQINLQSNRIQIFGDCLFADFPSKPTTFIILNNILTCDCQAVWLYDWIQAQPEKTLVGQCHSPENLANSYLISLNRTDLCPPDTYTPPQCPDLYITTTPAPTTTTPTTTIPKPKIVFTFVIMQVTENSISITLSASDKTDVTGYKLEKYSNNAPKEVESLHRDTNSYIFTGLESSTSYTICMIPQLNGVDKPDFQICHTKETLNEIIPGTSPASTTPTQTKTEALNVPVIVGASVGSVILVIILVLIIYILCKPSHKKKERTPMATGIHFAAHADLPHAGGTAKRFAKKPEKEGASPDDVNITVISGPDMNKDRLSNISTGSYQYLNTKTNPVENGKALGHTNGHYMNNVEDRPLPNAPKGATGYVNDSFERETSPNAYNAINI